MQTAISSTYNRFHNHKLKVTCVKFTVYFSVHFKLIETHFMTVFTQLSKKHPKYLDFGTWH